jgi:hypothetical protein
MKHYSLILLLSLLALSCKKDPPIPDLKPSEFQKNYGGSNDEFGKAVLEYPNGDLYVVATTNSFGYGQNDVYVIKTDAKGNTIWTKFFGGTGDDEPNEIIQDADGNLLIIGTTDSYGAGSKDIYLLKIDTTGAMLWHKEFGGVADEIGEDITIADDGNYQITGMTASFGNGLRDVYLIKTNTSGTVIWSKTYGGALDDGGISLCKGSSGNLMLYCFTDNFGALNRDTYVIKVNSAGDSLDSWLYGGADYEQAVSISPTTDGNFVICGHTASFGHPEHNVYALKIAENGAVLWEKDYGNSFHDGAERGEQSDDGGFVFAGRSNSFGNNYEQVYIVKTDASGNLQWQKDIGGSEDDAGYNMVETDDSYIIVGNTLSVTNGNNDVFLVKILKP